MSVYIMHIHISYFQQVLFIFLNIYHIRMAITCEVRAELLPIFRQFR